MNSISRNVVLIALVLALPRMAVGQLIDNGDGTVTDPDVCLMWTRDANTASQHMSWPDADAYVTTSNTNNLLGYNDWRLPSALNLDGTGPCYSESGLDVQCSESELGHLYYTELGNAGGGPLTNTGPFLNLDPVYYWTGTESMPGWAYEFGFLVGSQTNAPGSNQNRIILVRDVVDPNLGCGQPPPPACSDGIDNDGDGQVDYPADQGCCSAEDGSEGFTFRRGPFTAAVAQLGPQRIEEYFRAQRYETARLGVSFVEWLGCRDRIVTVPPETVEEELHPPVCLEGPIGEGMPERCPPLDCALDEPGCMDPYQYRRVQLSADALHTFALWAEGQLSDVEFDERIDAMLGTDQLRVDSETPGKTRYMPRVTLATGASIGLLVVVVIVALTVAWRRAARARRGPGV